MTVWATRADQVDLRGPNPHDLARSRHSYQPIDKRQEVSCCITMGSVGSVFASFDTSPSAAEVTDAPQLAEGLAPCDSTAARGASRSAAQPKLCTDSRSDLDRDESMQFASLLRRRLAYGAGHPDPRQDSLGRPPGRRDPLSQRRPHPRVDAVAGLA